MKNIILFILFFIQFPLLTHAQTKPQFALPLDCTLNKDCWVVNYVDIDTHEKNALDFTCAKKTQEGHEGTDFAIRSRIEMKKGVNVLAAKDGKVLRLREGLNDTPKSEDDYKNISNENKDCGNGIILDHGNGLLTYYCHLKENSIKVAINDNVQKGDIIAQVGQSGLARYPHLHFTVIWEGGQIDPFTGQLKEEGCGRFKQNLWEDELTYDPYTIFDGGFASNVPDFEIIKQGQNHPNHLPQTSEALVYWVGFYHANIGDEITLTITDPDGEVWAQREHVIEKNRELPSYQYTGRQLKKPALNPGQYEGKIQYKKKGHPVKTLTHTIEIK
ncbi:MAG: M23 family metallopeptidase [Bdellovibrionales bacterium]